MDRMRGCLIAVLVVLAVADVHAQSVRYVTDSLTLEARTGPSTGHRIVRMLESGTRVSVLEEADGYSRARMPDGADVWILSRYLQSEPVASERLAAVTEELESLRAEKVSLTEALGQAREVAEQAEAALGTAQLDNQELRQELASIKQAAASTLATRDENTRLTAEVDTLRQQLDLLGSEARALKEGREREWFIAGAGVLGAGMLLGLLLPKLGRRKRRSWSGL